MSKENELKHPNSNADEGEEDDNQSDISNDESLPESSAEAGASTSSNRNQSSEPPSKNNNNTPNPKKRTKSSSGPGSSSKPRLTPTQKNTNHKDAENKRRNAIRERFTELSLMVPGAEGQERSEQVMLCKTTEFLRAMLDEQRKLERLAASRGIVIDESQKLKETDFGGRSWRQGNMIAYEKTKLKKEI